MSSRLGCVKTLLFSHNSNPSQLQRAAEDAGEDEVVCGGWRRTAIEGIPAAVGNMAVPYGIHIFQQPNLMLRAQRPLVPHVRAAAGTKGLPGR